MTTPELSNSQRLGAAAKSLQVRQGRAALLLWVSGDGPGPAWPALRFADALSSDVSQGMRVLRLLLALPGIGPVKARRMLLRAGIDPSRTVRRLGANQRAALLDEVAKYK